MHIITGLLVSAMLRGKGSPEQRGVPSFRGVLETKHLLPSRIRLSIPTLVQNHDAKETVLAGLKRLKGIETVSVNLISGSVVIFYDNTKLKPELVIAAMVRILGLEKEIEKPPLSMVSKELTQLGEALNRALFEQSGGLLDLWTAVPLMLAGFGIYKLFSGAGALGGPGALTLLWWAYSTLFKGRSAV